MLTISRTLILPNNNFEKFSTHWQKKIILISNYKILFFYLN